MICAACQTRNGDDAARCLSCEAVFGASCSACGQRSPVGAKFCAGCGQPLRQADVAIERRQLTVLFCDIADPTALSERLSAEDLRDLLNAFQRLCRDAVLKYEGHVAQFLGDGVMAYFGYPRAHEDDAVRAVRAALRVLESLEHANAGIGRRLGANVRVRLGIHTGLAVVGEVGPGGDHDRLAVGDTVNLAARVESVAALDTVTISASTGRLVQGFIELDSLGLHSLKGFTQPVELFRVLRETDARSRLEAAALSGLTPYIGRRRELGGLADAWHEARAGADRVVVVRGEAGIGKSRIIEAFRRTQVDGAATTLECYCSPLTQASELAPFIDMLERRFDQRTGRSSPASRAEALRIGLSEHSRFGQDALPLLASLLSLPAEDDSALTGLSPVRRRTRTLEVLRAWLAYTAERTPTLLLFEDLHWADPSSLDLLDLLVASQIGGRTLICATTRPEFQVRWSQSHVSQVDLGRLSDTEAETIAVRVAGGRALPPAVLARIIERAEGVPLFVEEVTKSVLESGALIERSDRYDLNGELRDGVIPATVQDSLVARFDRLGSSRPVAQLGAAIGREFTYPLIRAASGLGDGELRHHLDRLCESGLVQAQGEAPSAAYIFKHALIQDAIYGTLLKKDRRAVHERIYSELQNDFPEVVGAHPERAAYHAEQAGLRREAGRHRKDAGLRSLGRAAITEAARHLTRAVELVDALEEPARTKEELELLNLLAPAYMVAFGWASPELERTSVRQRELALSRGDARLLWVSTFGLYTVHFLRGALAEALADCRELEALPVSRSVPMLRNMTLQAMAYALYPLGHYQEALQYTKQGAALFDPGLERQAEARVHASTVNSLWMVHASCLWLTGLQDQVEPCLESWAEQTADSISIPSRVSRLIQRGFVLHLLRDARRMRESALEARAVCEAEAFAMWLPIARMQLAWATAHLGGDADTAATDLRAARAGYRATNAQLHMTSFCCMEVETLLLAGRPAEALPVLLEARERAEQAGERYVAPEIYRLTGEVARALGRPDEAGTAFTTALELGAASGAHSLELRAAIGLYRLRRDQSSLARLRATLSAFTEGFAQPDLQTAQRLIDEAQAGRLPS